LGTTAAKGNTSGQPQLKLIFFFRNFLKGGALYTEDDRME
jgi:hypothetical protein